jgi:hypothetical protein
MVPRMSTVIVAGSEVNPTAPASGLTLVSVKISVLVPGVADATMV